jgi:hypothetical protein
LINLKWSAVAGGIGLILSLLVGFISGAGFPIVLIRAFVFGAAFFVLAGAAWMVISNFIPELLNPREEYENSGETPGSRVDISLGDGQESALPEMYRGSGSGDEVDSIADLLQGKGPPVNNAGMDQNREDGYTKNSGAEFPAESPGNPAGSQAASSGAHGQAEVLPDLDSMAAAFGPSGGEPAETKAEAEEPVVERRPTGNKSQSLKGDFDPKELAAAIRTKINKE